MSTDFYGEFMDTPNNKSPMEFPESQIVYPDKRKVYNPEIREDQIHRLYLLKQETGIPMTKLVRLALSMFLKKVSSNRLKTIFSSQNK